MIVLTIGDSHGNQIYLKRCFEQAVALRERVQEDVLLISVGDFGFWPTGHRFLKWVKNLCKSTGVPLWVVDGNHDFPGNGDRNDAGYLGYSEPNPVFGETVFCHLPRGAVFKLGDKNILTLGGTVSIDRGRRVLGRSYWIEEQISDIDVENALRNAEELKSSSPKGEGKIDIMLTHDAPFRPDGYGPIRAPHDPALPGQLDYQIEQIHKVWSTVRPPLLVHGHWHHQYQSLERFEDPPFGQFIHTLDMHFDKELVTYGGAGHIVGLGFENTDTSTFAFQIEVGESPTGES